MTTFLADSIDQPVNLVLPNQIDRFANSVEQPANLDFSPDGINGLVNVNITGPNGVTFHNFKVKSYNYAWTDDTSTSVDITSNATQFYLRNVTHTATPRVLGNPAYYTSPNSIYYTTDATVTTGNVTLELESTNIAIGPGTSSVNYIVWPPALSPAERIKQIMQERQAPRIILCKSIARTSDIREVRARETLRRVLGLKNFATFMKRGFVAVKAKSGLMYQIFPGHGITNVYNSGKKIETLCVVLTRDFAPTDSLIMRYLLILNNEDRFRSLAVRRAVGGDGYITFGNSGVCCTTQRHEDKSLAQIYKEIKGMAA